MKQCCLFCVQQIAAYFFIWFAESIQSVHYLDPYLTHLKHEAGAERNSAELYNGLRSNVRHTPLVKTMQSNARLLQAPP